MNRKSAALLVAALVGASFISAAVVAEDQIYKWRDAQGVWHFSSNAPEGTNAQRVSIRHSTTVVAADPVPVTGEDGTTAVTPPTAAAGTAGMIGPKSANCKSAKDAVTILTASPKVMMDADGDGKQEELTAQQHIEELERRKAQVKAYCAEA